jgi:hypothetical protein
MLNNLKSLFYARSISIFFTLVKLGASLKMLGALVKKSKKEILSWD